MSRGLGASASQTEAPLWIAARRGSCAREVRTAQKDASEIEGEKRTKEETKSAANEQRNQLHMLEN